MAHYNIKITVTYDGTNYNGFQSQLNGNTIEDKLKKAITQITNKKLPIYCAGRTDSGVHAEGQVVNFFTEKTNMDEKNWFHALNSLLPQDIRITDCEFVSDDFHSRKSCVAREYCYTIRNSHSISALDTKYTVQYIHPLDINLLQKYCNILVGKHDFTSFCALGDVNNTKIKYLYLINIEKKNDFIFIKIVGNAFLQHMIRIIIGTILKLHRFDKSPEDMKKILEGKNRKLAGPTYASKGLIFKNVYYNMDELILKYPVIKKILNI